ncbi:FKBP-type peptidyl-prolyl cis-trans isomerase [Pelagibaculum spongiae]|uniref:Peptidyl-prolyl cis-trans isomerase n=1 Tax=Pelagibaculum spongiae TaxID=2080658 RepID=A0A2V1GSI1_9GAMM|nr:peptidylprolyl isomerase [Pelagibaculum spongiae]PVZ67673.1 peptidylprolyl isomerase [Pelagibaculum spongiae]
MQIQENSHVSFHYELTIEGGDFRETSHDAEPMEYIHGHGMIIHGLEEALTGHKVGDKLQVQVAPEDGYGEWDEALIQAVPREAFEDAGEITIGMRFQAQTPFGMQAVTIVEIGDEEVKLDANHAFAGKTLNFDVELSTVRPATDDEIAALQSDAEGGCCGGGSCGGEGHDHDHEHGEGGCCGGHGDEGHEHGKDKEGGCCGGGNGGCGCGH